MVTGGKWSPTDSIRSWRYLKVADEIAEVEMFLSALVIDHSKSKPSHVQHLESVHHNIVHIFYFINDSEHAGSDAIVWAIIGHYLTMSRHLCL